MPAPSSDVFLPSGGGGGSLTSGKLLGLPKPVVYIGAVVGAYLAYRYFKNRGSQQQGPPAVTMPACGDGSTPDPITGLCQNGLYPGQLVAFPGQAGTQFPPGYPGQTPPPPGSPPPVTPPPTTPPPGDTFSNTIWIHGNPGYTYTYTGDPSVPAWFQIGNQWFYYTPGATDAGYPGSAQSGTPPPGTTGMQSTDTQTQQSNGLDQSSSPLGAQGAAPDFRGALTSPGGGQQQIHVMPPWGDPFGPPVKPPVHPGPGGVPIPAGDTGTATHGAGYEITSLSSDHLHLAAANAMMRNPFTAPIAPEQATSTYRPDRKPPPHWVPPPFRWPPTPRPK